jgi:hypothetical protein
VGEENQNWGMRRGGGREQCKGRSTDGCARLRTPWHHVARSACGSDVQPCVCVCVCVFVCVCVCVCVVFVCGKQLVAAN